jgi:thiol-disulfide isomerase/thioredoxin
MFMKSLLLGLLAFALPFSLHAGADKSMLNQPLPDLKVDYLKSTPDLKGKVVILEFWATWCPPCRDSIPHLNKLYASLKDKGLEIVGVTDEDKRTIREFTKKVPMDYPVAIDRDDKLSKAFGVRGIPHAVVADRTGKIVWEGHPMQLNEKSLEKWLAEKAPEPASAQ